MGFLKMGKDFMGMFKCTYFPKPYLVPAYIFKPLSTLKTWPLGPLGGNIPLFSVFYLLTVSLCSLLHAASKVSFQSHSLCREVSWLQNKLDPDPVFKAGWTLSVDGVSY